MILETAGGTGGTGPVAQNQAISTPMLGDNSSMPPMSPSVNKSGNSRMNYHLSLRTGNWIEDTPFKIPREMFPWFGPPGGEPSEPFFPNIDLLCGESVVSDSAKDGGDFGYRAFRDLMTPTDQPKGEIEAPAAQHFNDLYKVCYLYFSPIFMVSAYFITHSFSILFSGRTI